MNELLSQIKALATGADSQTRRTITDSLRNLSISLEDPDDTVERIAFAPLQAFTAKVGVELDIFKLLAASTSPMKIDLLTKNTNSDPILLGRLLRFWASMSMVTETDIDTFTANNITHVLASPKGESYVNIYYEIVLPVLNELPRFLEKNGYVNPTDPLNLPLQDAYNFEGDIFAYFKAFPKKQALFNTHMTLQHSHKTNWDVLCSLLQKKQPVAGEALFIDIGGGTGHQCRGVRKRFPDNIGEIILQDLPQVIASSESSPGVTNMAYDIFTPQPITEAYFYYFRGVLHDFPDEKCRMILSNTVKSMGPHSTILLDELVLPDKNVNWQITGMDLQMMTNMGSQERTQRHWTRLLGSVGLCVKEIKYHGTDAYQGIIVAVKLT